MSQRSTASDLSRVHFEAEEVVREFQRRNREVHVQFDDQPQTNLSLFGGPVTGMRQPRPASVRRLTGQLSSLGDGSGNRRQDRRYDLTLKLSWQLIHRRRPFDSGSGTSIDLSSKGILFDAGRLLPSGLNIELRIAWPVESISLIVYGRIVRTSGLCAAVVMVRREFHGASQVGAQCLAASAGSSGASVDCGSAPAEQKVTPYFN